MKYFIKIDRDSIKENENWGSKRTIINTREIMHFESRNIDWLISNDIKYQLREHNIIDTYFGESWNEYKGEIMTESIDKCRKNFKEMISSGILVNVECNHETVTHHPIARYSYKYENTRVKCSECEEEIMSDDLEADSGWEVYSNAICPKCDEWDCCELEYENINDLSI